MAVEKRGADFPGFPETLSQSSSLPVARHVNRMEQESGSSSGQPSQLLQQPAHPLSAQSISCLLHCNWRKGLCLGFQSLLSKELHSYLGQHLSQIQTLGALDVTFVSVPFRSLEPKRSQAVLECGSFQHGF